MYDNPEIPSRADWMESSGLKHLLRTFKLAAHPTRLGIALAALLAMLSWGKLLDWVWTASGRGIDANAIALHLGGVESSAAVTDAGVFEVFIAFEVACIRDAIESVRYGRLAGPIRAGEPVSISTVDGEGHMVRGAFANILLMGRGVVWLIRAHFFYAFLFLVVTVLIWSVAGGLICRMVSVQFARDELISIKQAFGFVREKLWGGFFAAPFIPLLMCLVIGLLLTAGGLFLRFPVLGNMLGGLLFFLALMGGGIVALILAGAIAGGSLFWPTVATEGSDSFDAISRSFNYVFAQPLRAIWYAAIALVYGSFCWLFVRFMVWLSLAAAHLFVDFGSGGKLSELWATPTFENLYSISVEARSGGRWTSASLIGLWILPVTGLVWAFLCTFYFAGSTVIYYLLRRDVDEADLGEIYLSDSDTFEPAPLSTNITDEPVSPAKTSRTGSATKSTGDVESQPSGIAKKPPQKHVKPNAAKDDADFGTTGTTG